MKLGSLGTMLINSLLFNPVAPSFRVESKILVEYVVLFLVIGGWLLCEESPISFKLREFSSANVVPSLFGPKCRPIG